MLWALILASASLLLAFILKRSVRQHRISYFVARKYLHICLIGFAAVSVFLSEAWILLIAAGAGTLTSFIAIKSGYSNFDGEEHNSWGLFYFFGTYFALLLVFQNQLEVVFYSFMVLAVADGAASLAGKKWGQNSYSFGTERKTFEGSLFFFVSTFFVLEILPSVLPVLHSPFHSTLISLVVCVFLTLTEALSVKGRDNLWVPLAMAWWLVSDTVFLTDMHLWLFALIGVGGVVAWRLKWLTNGGAVAAVLLGWFTGVSVFPELLYAFLLFFLAGSMLSAIPFGKRRKDSATRNANQVFANGLASVVMGGLYFLTSVEIFLLGSLASLAAATSDTASSEIGVRWGRKPINILNGKSIVPGLSGGISFAGLLAGIVFSIVFSLIVSWIYPLLDNKAFLIIAVAGFAGNVLDSLLGALVQVKYRTSPKASWRDFCECNTGCERKGIPWVTNDMVNLMATSLTGALVLTSYIWL